MRVNISNIEPIRPSGPVELVIVVDSGTLRAATEWSTFEKLAGDNLVNEDFVHAFVHTHREELELAIRAHLYAQGIPLSGRLVLTWDELTAMHPSVLSSTSPTPPAKYAAGKT